MHVNVHGSIFMWKYENVACVVYIFMNICSVYAQTECLHICEYIYVKVYVNEGMYCMDIYVYECV